ncbi:MAG: methylenetetrahydrofolate reductase, partial [Armatimonadetes bacterium]|nr:methylenetetrahydrofolate reductase [Armatimonadota bacterium]
MTIHSLIQGGKRCFSFEYFPPRTEKGEVNLFKTIRSMKELDPTFVSITCGAGGSTRHRTVEWADRIKNEIGIEVVVHMTCLGMDSGELKSELDEVRARGLQNILALRGDPPLDDPSFAVRDGACRYAIDLVRLVGESYAESCLLGACHPEGHLDATGRDADLQRLKEKCDAGLDVLITQLFFDNRHYFDFVSRARDAGIGQPIVPGIMPVTNLGQLEKFTKMCGATIPPRLREKLEACGDDKEAVLSVGVEHATAQ